MSILLVDFEKSHIYTILCNVCFSQEHIYHCIRKGKDVNGYHKNKLCHLDTCNMQTCHISHIVRKTAFCKWPPKYERRHVYTKTRKLIGCEVFSLHRIVYTIPPIPKSEILCCGPTWTWSETLKKGFLMMQLHI